MKCRKDLVLSGFRVQYVDLREPKPRTPQELIHVADSQWVYAMGLTGQNILAHIQEQYERIGYKVFSVVPLKPKRVVELDLCRLWEEVDPPISEEILATNTTEEEDAAQ